MQVQNLWIFGSSSYQCHRVSAKITVHRSRETCLCRPILFACGLRSIEFLSQLETSLVA